MNVAVAMELQDEHERELFDALVHKIEAWRGLTAVERHDVMYPAPAVIDEVAPAPTPAQVEALSSPPPITDADLETAITAYWKKMGLPAAKGILSKYEVERVGAIPANRRAEALLDMGF